MGLARCPSALGKEAVIRQNDTFRSNFALAHPDYERASTSPSKINEKEAKNIPITNEYVDQ